MANQTGRPIAPARKLIAAVLGTIAVFVMVFGLGMSSWAIVALGAAMLALSIILGLVNVVRRGARAWVAGQGQVKAISDPPLSSVYGRAELQLTVVAPGLPVTDVLIRDPRVPIGKWPRPGDTLPITVDVDDMRRVRIDWEQAADRADDGDPPPPSFEPADEYLDDDLLGEPEPPPWATRDRAWSSDPDEPPPPPPPGADDDDDDDLLNRPIVVRDTPAGPVLEGHFVDHDDSPPVLPQRARPASADPTGPIPDQSRPSGTRPSPRPQKTATMAAASGGAAGATTATVDPEDHPTGTSTQSPEAPPAPADPPASAVPGPRASGLLGSTTPWTEPPPEPEAPPAPQPPIYDPIDLPLDGDPEPPPESAPQARDAVDQDLIAPPPGTAQPARVFAEAETVSDTDRTPTPAAAPTSPAAVPTSPAPAASSAPPAAPPPTISGIDIPAGPGPTAAAAGVAPPAQRGPWADLEGGYEPDDRTDELITAYPSARPGPAGAIHGVGITVLVTDLARSIAFYRDTLGFFEIDSGTGSAVLASGDTRLVLRTVHGLGSDVGGLISLNLEVGDVSAVYDELKSKNVTFEHGPRTVNRGDKLELWAASFYDPDGHNVAITQWRAAR